VLNYRKDLKELVLSVALGFTYGTGIAFFVFLRLGFPHDLQTARYVSGLFLVAGLELGLAVAASRFPCSQFCRRAK
jgi:hypothetical protein